MTMSKRTRSGGGVDAHLLDVTHHANVVSSSPQTASSSSATAFRFIHEDASRSSSNAKECPSSHQLLHQQHRWRKIVGSLLPRCTRFVLLIVLSILLFGTLYSTLTSTNPCQILQVSLQSKATTKTLLKLYHYQSKDDAITPEVQSWLQELEISSPSQIYPNIEASSEHWTCVYWSDESCQQLVQDHFSSFLDTYTSFPHNIQRVDSCRYLLLKQYGGIYADTDVSLHSKLITDLIPDGIGLVESPYRYNENVQNSLMTASAPNLPFWDKVIELIQQRKGSNKILSTTGPKLLDDAVAQSRDHKNDNHSSDKTTLLAPGVHVLPCELFQRLPVGQWDTTFLNILGRELLSRAIPMKGCGSYGDGRCEITRHTGKASWTKSSGRIA